MHGRLLKGGGIDRARPGQNERRLAAKTRKQDLGRVGAKLDEVFKSLAWKPLSVRFEVLFF